MNKNLLGISGKIGSGKDTFFEILKEKTGGIYENKKFAAKLKIIASLLTNMSVENFEDQEFKKTFLSEEWDYSDSENIDLINKKMTVREFLQRLGTDAMRDGLHTNVWVNSLFCDYFCETISVGTNEFDITDMDKEPKWAITDLRFPNEYYSIKKRNGILIRINRPDVCYNNHPSETSLDNFQFDYVINNDGTLEDFKIKIENCLQHFNII